MLSNEIFIPVFLFFFLSISSFLSQSMTAICVRNEDLTQFYVHDKAHNSVVTQMAQTKPL